ncbi:NAD-dependent epimerase/dehydratase family protein [Segetibacter sp. 3557_3]|uniref:NAD-dependent epimerase/dehydratase family protein n=1 Tax=Segetibacter sp. 3557_3 TaxID=2547429 RepID=UPI001059193F|nr:NAD-dependent epimerase/dehydratase family protein [Segetibacter sp. 3557_3]TDH20813.1 NAD-dependent epimerase/dehydratase family protein [Segetibacter sp. 3557_3]
MKQLSILITGGCGFIGSNLCVMLKEKYPAYQVIAVDNLKRRGSELNIERLARHQVLFVHADIRFSSDLVMEHKPDFIIDAAAEPSVLAGVGSSLDYVIQTNLNGTIHTLEAAAKHRAKFIFLSTSRVYPIKNLERLKLTESDSRFELTANQSVSGVSENGINEDFPLNNARSIYGTTKLASELLIEEFREFYDLEYVINRCGVVAGPFQMGKVDQGVIALWVASHYWKKDISYFGFNGSGKQVRDVLHIEDLFRLIDHQIHHFSQVSGSTFNAGGGLKSSTSLKELTSICKAVTGTKLAEHAVTEKRKGDIPWYITDNKKITSVTGWAPGKSVYEIVEDVFHWINKNEQQLKGVFKM